MGSGTGLSVLGTYTGDGSELATLLALIPNPDVSPAQAGGVADGSGGFLDQMSPAAAAQLRVEIEAMMAGYGGDENGFATGSHVVTAGEVTATVATIDTGLTTAVAFDNLMVVIERPAGTVVTLDAAVTDNNDGTFDVEDGAVTYVLTAGDIIKWFAVAGAPV